MKTKDNNSVSKMKDSKDNNNNNSNSMVEVQVMEVDVELKPVRKRRGSAKRHRLPPGPRKRVLLYDNCIQAMDKIKNELGFRTVNDIIHWLLHQVRPELVPDQPQSETRDLVRVKGSCQNSLSLVDNEDQNLGSSLSISKELVPSVRVPVRVTVAQASTLFFDTPATLGYVLSRNSTFYAVKAERLVAGAAAYGSQLVVFPEAFIGGHPHSATFDATVPIYSAEMEDDVQKYYDSAIVVPGPEVDRLAKIAGTYKVHLVIGVVERTKCYLYSTVLVFDSQGRRLGHHRKQIQLASESAVWYCGNKSSLPIFKTSIGKIGVVMSWDNKLPLLRSELYAKGVEIYCAPTADSRSVWNASMTHIAREGGCFVLSANQFCQPADNPLSTVNSNTCPSDVKTCVGGSMIVSPSGTALAGPNYKGECLISADIDLNDIITARTEYSEAGKNARPDHVEVIEID